MTQTKVQIGEYTLRAAGVRDLPLIAEWIAGDADHRNRVRPEFFCTDVPGLAECFAFEDALCRVVFYIRMTLDPAGLLRLDTQFGPDVNRADRQRSREGMVAGFVWLVAAATGVGIRRISFQSVHAPLVAFAKKRLGFLQDGQELFYMVSPSALD